MEIATILRLLIEAKGQHKVAEFVLSQDAIPVNVSSLKDLHEVSQELFMLLQLEVEDTLEEDSELEFGCFGVLLHVLHRTSCHWFATWWALASHQVRT